MSTEGSPPCAAELRAWLRLSHTGGIGPARGRALLQGLGPPEAVLEAGPGPAAEILQSQVLAAALFRRDPVRDGAIAAALKWLQAGPVCADAWDGPAGRRSLLVLADPRYPRRLLDLADPPLVLYCVGDVGWLSRPQVGIVGSRNATASGMRTAHELAGALRAAGWTVVSGMAEGIDQAAHEGGLAGVPGSAAGGGDRAGTSGGSGNGSGRENPGHTANGGMCGSTVAALGTGIDRIYPARHRGLALRIAGRGALLSEQPIGMPPLAANFPRRNRLIAAMASGVLVVEANLRSGSLITARLAADLGREVLAVPGSIHSPLARGCHSLIRQGAKLVESAEDILGEIPEICQLGLRWSTGSGPAAPAPGLKAAPAPAGAGNAPLPEDQARMLAAMSADPVRLETLAAGQRLPIAQALAALQTLELIGFVERQLDGSYVRCA